MVNTCPFCSGQLFYRCCQVKSHDLTVCIWEACLKKPAINPVVLVYFKGQSLYYSLKGLFFPYVYKSIPRSIRRMIFSFSSYIQNVFIIFFFSFLIFQGSGKDLMLEIKRNDTLN